METEKLYYADPFLTEFDARVLACEAVKDGFAVVLDRTAFYPEGGGQPYDTGVLGGAEVLDVHEKAGVITHKCASPLPVGETVLDLATPAPSKKTDVGAPKTAKERSIPLLIGAACVTVVLEVLTSITVQSPSGSLLNTFQLAQGTGLLNVRGLLLAAVLLVLTNWVKPTKNLHPIVFIMLSALVGIIVK